MNRVIRFHYRLTDPKGKVIDSSEGAEPLAFLEGQGQIIPGLETVLVSLKKGDKQKVQIPCQEAYGSFDKNLIFDMDRKNFPTQQIGVGDVFEMNDNQNVKLVTVMKISDAQLTVNANHPLAGIDLTFDIEITDIREATAEEKAHGHVH